MRLVDAHAHLQSDAFAGDAVEVLDRAREAGVERLLIPGWDLPSSRSGLAFAQRHGLPTCVGIHPHVAAQADARTWDEIRDLAGAPEVAAVGETGLDYDRGFSPREAQLHNLRRHIELAGELGKPLILHCRSAPGARDAQDDMIGLLRDAGPGRPDWGAAIGDRPVGVLHSFSGPLDYAEAALELGLAVSFSGLVFRGGEEASADVARIVPPDRLLVETDAPYLKPRGVRGSRNEPRHVAVTAGWVRAQREDEDESAFGDALVTAFDRFVGTLSRD
jgi:TatD DNase family protein